MTEATTRHVPSRPLRRLIGRALEDGSGLRTGVIAYGDTVHLIAVAFEAEVSPLDLSDGDYQAVAADCGFARLLDLVHGMATTLEAAVAEA
jgi:hypothetical protein